MDLLHESCEVGGGVDLVEGFVEQTRVFSIVRGPLTASRASMDFWPAARRSFSIFSKAATSGFAAQMVDWETVAVWAERTAATKTGRHRKIAKRTANNM
jgi:hypothetical protein